jgi:hypothetical protein
VLYFHVVQSQASSKKMTQLLSQRLNHLGVATEKLGFKGHIEIHQQFGQTLYLKSHILNGP